jgi:hypothetical protein
MSIEISGFQKRNNDYSDLSEADPLKNYCTQGDRSVKGFRQPVRSVIHKLEIGRLSLWVGTSMDDDLLYGLPYDNDTSHTTIDSRELGIPSALPYTSWRSAD